LESGEATLAIMGIVIIPVFSLLTSIAVIYTILKSRTRGEILDAILLGVGGVGLVSIVKMLIILCCPLDTLQMAIVVAPLVEEFIRNYLVYEVIRGRKTHIGTILGGIVGVGFATVENITYGIYFALIFGPGHGLQVVMLRTILLPLGHVLYSLLFAYAASRGHIAIGFVTCVFLHSFWNSMVIYFNIDSLDRSLPLILSHSFVLVVLLILLTFTTENNEHNEVDEKFVRKVY